MSETAQAQQIRELQKQVRELHTSDITENGCFWLFVLFLLALFVSIFFWGAPYYHHHHHPAAAAPTTANAEPNPGYYMKHQRNGRQHAPEHCSAGETWDAEVELCGPTLRTPLALEPAIMNNSMAPCVSFYESMCGKYIATHTNENRAFTYGWRRTRQRLRRLIVNGTATTTTPGGAFYQACMRRGSPAAAKEALLEYQHVLHVILGPVRTHADLPSAFGKLARYGYTGPFALSIERHPLEARVLPFMTPDGFPDALLDEGRLFQVLQAARALTQYTTIQETHQIEGILRVSRTLREHRAPLQLSNVTDYGSYLEQLFPQHLVPFSRLQSWPWERYMQALDGNNLRFANEQVLWAPDRGYLEWLLARGGWQEIAVADWKAFIEFSVLWNNNQFEPELPNNVYFRQHDAQGPVGRGARLYHRIPRSISTKSPEDQCVALTEHMLPGWTADAFLKRYMPRRQEIRTEVDKMVRELLARLKDKVASATWLPDADRITLARKVDATLVRVLEPDDWHVEPFLGSVSVDRHDHNMNLVRRYRVQRNLALWHKDAAASWWSRSALAFFAMPLTEMNAYYSGPTNSITLLAGVLQHPLYNPDYDAVSKWAILGSVVGHELSHMLDTHGLHWDAEGRYAPHGILTPEGMGRFYGRVECVVREYGPAPAGCEDANAAYGNSTIDEDMADLMGIGLSYAALPESVTMGDRQHFFMVLGQAFCESYDQRHRCDAVANDEHAVAEFRIDRTFWNLGAWQDAFACKREQESCIPYA